MDNDNKMWELIGGIKSDVSHIRQSVDSLQEHMRILSEKSIVTEMKAKAAHERLDDIEPVVEEVKNWKLSVLAISTALTSVIIGGWAVIRTIAEYKKDV